MEDKPSPRAQNSLGLGSLKIKATMTVEDPPMPLTDEDKKPEPSRPYDAEKE
jgi:hypothetical protein